VEGAHAVNKVNVAPRVAIDRPLAATLATLAARIDRLPSSAFVTPGSTATTRLCVWGREVDQAAMTSTITGELAKPDAPSSLSVRLAVTDRPARPTSTR
jgi:hypothetical protein